MGNLKPKLNRNKIRIDTATEKTASAGITVDGIPIEDGLIDGVDVTKLVEYSTSEVDLGGHYRKCFSVNAFEEETSFAHGISGLTDVYSISGYLSSGASIYLLPCETIRSIVVTSTNIEITGWEGYEYNGYIVLEYNRS